MIESHLDFEKLYTINHDKKNAKSNTILAQVIIVIRAIVTT